MTVEEITRKIEEANLDRARTNPQPAIVPVPKDPVPPPTVDLEVTPAVPASDVDTNKPAANRLEEIPEPPPNEPSPPLPAPSLTTPALSSNPPPAMIASGAQPEWERTRLIRAPVDAVSVAAEVRSPWRDFGIGAALLVAAGALLVVLVRNVRRGNRPSLITESFQRRDPPMGSQGSRS
jgi:hypothetical protein